MTTNVIATKNTSKSEKPSDNFDLAEAFKLRYRNGLSLQRVADMMQIPKSTLDCRLQRILKTLPNAEEVELYRREKAYFLEAAGLKLYNKITDDETVKEASLNNAGYVWDKVETHLRLEKGLATSRIDSFSVVASLDELARRKRELMDKVMASVQPVVLDTVSTPSIIPTKQDK